MTSPEAELEECLKNKCCTSSSTADDTISTERVDPFQCLPDFAETMAFVHQFGTLFELSPFSFDDLAQALHQLHQVGAVQQQQYCPPNLLFDNLFAKILHYCGHKFERSSLYNSLHKLIRRVNRWTATPFDGDLLFKINKREEKSVAENDDGGETADHQKENGANLFVEGAKVEEEEVQENGGTTTAHQGSLSGSQPNDDDDDEYDDKPALSNLSAAQVLRLIVLLFDYLLQCVHEDGGLDPKFTDEQLHPTALCVDPLGHKFWYFAGDTWLFMEQGRPDWMDEEIEKSTTRHQLQQQTKKESPTAAVTSPKKRWKERQRHIRTIFDKKKKKKRRKTEGRKEEEERKRRAKEEEEKEEKEGKRKEEEETGFTSQELDKACENLFTGTLFRPVCTRSDHFVALINAYRNQPTDAEAHNAVADKLEQCLQQVRDIEQERRRKAAERERERWAAAAAAARISSTRAFALMEKRRVEEEQMRARKEKQRMDEEQMRARKRARQTFGRNWAVEAPIPSKIALFSAHPPPTIAAAMAPKICAFATIRSVLQLPDKK